MPRRRTRTRAALLASLLVVAPAARAANTKGACIAASQRGQELTLDGKLLQAREAFLACVQLDCPAAVRNDCGVQLARLDESIPTVVVSARRPDGTNVMNARVHIDGGGGLDVDGSAMRVDPGRHVFQVESAGSPTVAVEAIVTEGTRLQRVDAVFPAPAAPVPQPKPLAPEPTPPSPPPATVPTGTIVASAASVLALGALAYFGVSAVVQSRDLHAHPGTYTQSDIDSLNAKMIAADISLGIAVTSAVIALVFWSTRDKAAPKSASR